MSLSLPTRAALLAAAALALLGPAPASAAVYGVVKFGGYLPTSGDLPGSRPGFAFELDGGVALARALSLELGFGAYETRVDLTSPLGSRFRAPLSGVTFPLTLQLGGPLGRLEAYAEAGLAWHYVALDTAFADDSDTALGYHVGAGVYVRDVLVAVRYFRAQVDLLDVRGMGVDGALVMLGLGVGPRHPPPRPRR